jgi:predicted transcriptional regulator
MLNERRTVEPVLMLQGVGGIGKTVLAIHVVRQRAVKEWYRGKIFWVDVEQYGEAGGIRRLAHDVGGKNALPAGDTWRFVAEALRGKRVMIVLNGVEEEIDLDRWADLLPLEGRLLVTTRGVGTAGTRVGTQTLRLTGLSSDTAQELLTRDVTVDVRGEDLAWVVKVVDGLPLALYIANTIGHWEGGLSGLVSDLRAQGLNTLHIGDDKKRSVRVTFELSYRWLDEKDQTLFRVLGVFLPRFKVEVVAAVLGTNEAAARRGLRRLMQVGLVDNVRSGEYRMHNLVYQYATELGQADERWQEWQKRFAAYYLELARRANAAWDLETLGEHMAEISQAALCALALRDRKMLVDYVCYAGLYVSLDESAALEAWRKWAADQADDEERVEMALRTARFCLETGQPERALELAQETRSAFEATESEGKTSISAEAWVEATLVAGEALLAMGRAAEATQGAEEQALWERVAELNDGDELLFRVCALSERVALAQGRDASCREQAEATRARWLAGRTSLEQAQLRLMRVVPLSDDPGEAIRALEERMNLAKEVGEQDAWLADALRRGFLLAQKRDRKRAEAALQEIETREKEAPDRRFLPWVHLLRAHVARAMGQDEEGERAYQTAVAELAGGFGETVFWQVEREGLAGETQVERAVEVWRRGLRVDDPFRYVEATGRMYPVFAWQREGIAPAEDEKDQAAQYQAAREEMRPMGLDLPEWEWFVEGDDGASGGVDKR